MAGWGSYSFIYGPLMAALLIGVMILLLRWAFSRGHSLVERKIVPSTPDNYGMLVEVTKAVSLIDGEMFKQQLAAAGVKATLAVTVDGVQLMVWAKDLNQAKRILAIY
jgi:hypothetical protein